VIQTITEIISRKMGTFPSAAEVTGTTWKWLTRLKFVHNRFKLWIMLSNSTAKIETEIWSSTAST
jgi:hypothetical protein